MTDQEIIKAFQDAGALLDGHFVLRSGLHSNKFFQAALLCDRHTAVAQNGFGIAHRQNQIPELQEFFPELFVKFIRTVTFRAKSLKSRLVQFHQIEFHHAAAIRFHTDKVQLGAACIHCFCFCHFYPIPVHDFRI